MKYTLKLTLILLITLSVTPVGCKKSADAGDSGG
jgi:hypothetical protein